MEMVFLPKRASKRAACCNGKNHLLIRCAPLPLPESRAPSSHEAVNSFRKQASATLFTSNYLFFFSPGDGFVGTSTTRWPKNYQEGSVSDEGYSNFSSWRFAWSKRQGRWNGNNAEMGVRQRIKEFTCIQWFPLWKLLVFQIKAVNRIIPTLCFTSKGGERFGLECSIMEYFKKKKRCQLNTAVLIQAGAGWQWQNSSIRHWYSQSTCKYISNIHAKRQLRPLHIAIKSLAELNFRHSQRSSVFLQK